MKLSELSPRQVSNARAIFDAALPFEQLAPGVVQAALMCAAAESSYLRYANDGSYARAQAAAIWKWYADRYRDDYPTAKDDREVYRNHMRESLGYPYDKVGGEALTTKDSVGHFQQREMYGYGPIWQLMDPGESTRIFIRGVQGSPYRVKHWLRTDKPANVDIATQVQWVQGSEFPTGDNYRPMEQVALELIERFGGLPTVKDGLDMATVQDVDNSVKARVSDRLDKQDQKLDALAADIAQIKRWIRGGYTGDESKDSNIGQTWIMLNDTVIPQMKALTDQVGMLTRWIRGGYLGDESDKSNVGGIWHMTNRIARKLLPDVKRPDRPDTDQDDGTPKADDGG